MVKLKQKDDIIQKLVNDLDWLKTSGGFLNNNSILKKKTDLQIAVNDTKYGRVTIPTFPSSAEKEEAPKTARGISTKNLNLVNKDHPPTAPKTFEKKNTKSIFSPSKKKNKDK